jgi:hypothetical protein
MFLPLVLFATAIGLLIYKEVDVSINNSYDAIFKKYGALYGIDWKFLKRISWIESKVGTYKSVKHGILHPTDIEGSTSSDKKSWGIMQSTIPTSRDYDPLATPEKLNNPDYSIMIGAKHIQFLKKKYFPNSERDLVMAYNHGQGNQLKFISKEQTRTLGLNEFVAGRDYYKQYLIAKEKIP